jgi:SAM-dependent methyltransferase
MKSKGHKDLRIFRRAARKLHWDESIFRGKRIDTYYDPGLISELFTKPIARSLAKNESSLPKDEALIIGDFGSGNGESMQILGSQLGRTYDNRVISVGIDISEYYLQAMKDRAPDVRPVRGFLNNLPFKPETFDAGVLRFALFFNSKDAQLSLLKQIYDVLKPDAVLVVLNYGVIDTKTAKRFDAFFYGRDTSKGYRRVEENPNNSHIPSLRNLKVIAQKVGFTTQFEGDLTKSIFGCVSAKNHEREFGLNDDSAPNYDARDSDLNYAGLFAYMNNCDSVYELNTKQRRVLKRSLRKSRYKVERQKQRDKRQELKTEFETWKQKGELQYIPDNIPVFPLSKYLIVLKKKRNAPSP